MTIKDFSGGVFSRLHPSLLKSNLAQHYINCDNTEGILRPVFQDSAVTNINIQPNGYWFTKAKSYVFVPGIDVSFVERHKFLYIFRDNESPIRIQSGKSITYDNWASLLAASTSLDLPKAHFPPVVTVPLIKASITPGDRDLMVGILLKDKKDRTKGEIKVLEVARGKQEESISYDHVRYRFTYYDPDTGIESQPSSAVHSYVITSPLYEFNWKEHLKSANVTGLNNDGALPANYKIRLYRLGGDITRYTLVEELPITTTTYKDTKSMVDIAGNHQLDTIDDAPCPKGLKGVVYANDTFIGFKDNRIYYSKRGRPSAWPITNYIEFDEDITGIGNTQTGMLVFTANSTSIVTGTSPESYAVYLLDDEIGCISYNSIQYVNRNLIWVSHLGVTVSAGGKLDVITLSPLGEITLNVASSAVVGKTYYLSLSGETYMLALDFRYGMCIKHLDGGNKLLNVKGVLVSLDPVSKKIYSLFKDETKTKRMRYTSPILTEGRYSELGMFKDFYIKYKGDIKLDIYIQTETKIVEIFSKRLDPDRVEFNAKTLGNQDGYAMWFKIDGTGEVHEVDFRKVGRENGK